MSVRADIWDYGMGTADLSQKITIALHLAINILMCRGENIACYLLLKYLLSNTSDVVFPQPYFICQQVTVSDNVMVIMNSQAEQKKLQSIIVISSSSASSLVWLSEVDEELSVPDLSLLPDPGGVPGHGDDEGLGLLGLLGQPAHGA